MEIELKQFEEYLFDPGTEKAKDHLVFPLFKKLFGNKFAKELDAADSAELFIEGKLLMELKSDSDDWRKGFNQVLHYSKKGLTFSAICVIAEKFVAVWKSSRKGTGRWGVGGSSWPSSQSAARVEVNR
jgi:hypothetical protein